MPKSARIEWLAATPKRSHGWALFVLAGVSFAATYAFVNWQKSGPPGMVWIPGGEFTMGWDGADGSVVERPTHRVRVSGFWMDETDVTNDQFRRFVEATGY